MLKYTEDHIKEVYEPDGNLDLDKATDIPALIVSETGGLGEEIGRAGTITRVRVVGGNYQIDYTLDRDIPGIPNAKLEEMAADLEVTAFAQWSHATGSERANYQLFVADLCRLLDVPEPEPASATFYTGDEEVAEVGSTPAQCGIVQQPWPTTLPEQIRAVSDVLTAASRPMAIDDIAEAGARGCPPSSKRLRRSAARELPPERERGSSPASTERAVTLSGRTPVAIGEHVKR